MEHSSKIKDYNPNYYGSPLNYFVKEHCRKDMVVNNIDLIIHDYKNKIITIIESKHENESIRTGQQLLLIKLRTLIPKEISRYKFQILIVKGNYPYKSADLLNVNGKVIKRLTTEQLIKFLNNDI